MSARPSVNAPNTSARPLSLPEELEKLDQSITLTLQEIDANFSRAHRIVTTSILPVVEQYGRHSDSIWQSSRFWKEFFEASANISLTGYEEPTELGGDGDTEHAGGTEAADEDTVESGDVTERPRSRATDEGLEEDGTSLVESPSLTVKSRQTPTQRTLKDDESEVSSSFSDYPSAYETLRREMDAKFEGSATPKRKPSPFKQGSVRRDGNEDPLLHRVLDKNYRVQATPHTARKKWQVKPMGAAAEEPTRAQPTRTLNPALDSSPFSPDLEAPKLRAEIFGTPGDKKKKGRAAPTPRGPRTPGISVQKPMGKSGFTPGDDGLGTARKTLFTGGKQRSDTTNVGKQERERDEIDWSDSDDESAPFGGMSPPKTIQFNMPQSKLLQTPAREASKKIVDDLLMTAGAPSFTGDSEDLDVPHTQAGHEDFDDSPSVVKVTRPDEDDSF